MRRRSTLLAVCAGFALLVSAAPAASADPGQTRVVGGRPSAEGAYPWMAYLNLGGGSCGGSLISKDVIISAAHCFAESGARSVTAYVGKINWRSGARRTSSKFKYGGTVASRDWAVIKLDQPIEDAALPALPVDDTFDTAPTFRAMGWGLTRENGSPSSTLMEVDVPLVPDAKCPKVVAAQEICAGDLAKGGIDTCQGDSGGPLVARDGDRWVLVGLTSWGDGCARRNAPGHYTQVSYFMNEIKSAIQGLGGTMPAGW